MTDDWKKTARLYSVYYRQSKRGEPAGCLGQIVADSVDEAERKVVDYFERSLEVIRVEYVKKLYSEDGDAWA